MSEPKTPRKYAHNRREYARSQAPEVSEPKTAAEVADQFVHLARCMEGASLAEFVRMTLVARDKQIRQQERARVREVLTANVPPLSPPHDRYWLGWSAAVDDIARDLGIDLQDVLEASEQIGVQGNATDPECQG